MTPWGACEGCRQVPAACRSSFTGEALCDSCEDLLARVASYGGEITERQAGTVRSASHLGWLRERIAACREAEAEAE